MAVIAALAERELAQKDAPRALHLVSDIDRETAALQWLSNIDKRWLLIIDNADGTDQDLTAFLDKAFRGNRGNILITTRNPSYRFHGNVGQRFFDFGGDSSLTSDEATQLLLRVAEVPQDEPKKSLAGKIAEFLGYLALAIVHAGSAIREGPISMEGYINYYNRKWKVLRKNVNELQMERTVYTTWELSHRCLERKGTLASEDAIELLHIFAFFHRENIPRSLLDLSVSNKKVEDEQSEEIARSQLQTDTRTLRLPSPSSIPADLWRTLCAAIHVYRGPPALPRLIQDGRESSSDDDNDFDVRVSDALRELTSLSLVSFNKHNNTYSMHPIVHTWARERPSMSLRDQFHWANVAGMVVSAAILLPIPSVRTTYQKDDYLISLLPHVEQVQEFRMDFGEKMDRSKATSWQAWLVRPFGTIFQVKDANEMLMLVKFSLVFVTSGHWREAEPLLIKVREFLHSTLGPRHEKSRIVTAFLSEVYIGLERALTAAGLQQEILEICQEQLGDDHPDTLRARDKLGTIWWRLGQYTKARRHQEIAVDGLKNHPDVGPEHEDTFTAMDNLGRTIVKFWEPHHLERGFQLHHEAVEGLGRILGHDHDKTLKSKQSLSRLAILLPVQQRGAFDPLQTISEVVDTLKANLGKEHPYALEGIANLSIVKVEAGQLHEAEKLVRDGLEVATRTLGSEHDGTLFGRSILGGILLQQGRYAEAETTLVQVTESQKSPRSEVRRGDFHPDRIGCLIHLSRVLYHQMKIDESIKVCDETITGLDIISEAPHPLRHGMVRAREQMTQLLGKPEHFNTLSVEFPWIYTHGGF